MRSRLSAKTIMGHFLDGSSVHDVAVWAYGPSTLRPLSWLASEAGQAAYHRTEDTIRRQFRKARKWRAR